MTSAQQLLNDAFSAICTSNNLKVAENAFTWSVGEAEEWLRRIASGDVYLSYSPNWEGDAYSPCLREV